MYQVKTKGDHDKMIKDFMVILIELGHHMSHSSLDKPNSKAPTLPTASATFQLETNCTKHTCTWTQTYTHIQNNLVAVSKYTGITSKYTGIVLWFPALIRLETIKLRCHA